VSRRWGCRRLGRGGRREHPEDQSLGRFAMAFCGVSLPAALNRIKIMQRTRLAISTFFSALAAGTHVLPASHLRRFQVCVWAPLSSLAREVHSREYPPPVPRYSGNQQKRLDIPPFRVRLRPTAAAAKISDLSGRGRSFRAQPAAVSAHPVSDSSCSPNEGKLHRNKWSAAEWPAPV
jgi:hypothetical protein